MMSERRPLKYDKDILVKNCHKNFSGQKVSFSFLPKRGTKSESVNNFTLEIIWSLTG